MDTTFAPQLLTGSCIIRPCGFTTTTTQVEDSPKQTRKAEQLLHRTVPSDLAAELPLILLCCCIEAN